MTAEFLVVGRVFGAADTQRLTYRRRAVAYRDAGGNVSVSVQTLGNNTEVTASADATVVADTMAQTIAPQVTGIDATRIEWTSTLTNVERQAATAYEEVY